VASGKKSTSASGGRSRTAARTRVSDLLRVPPGAVDLAQLDPAATPGAPGKRARTEADTADVAPLVADLQQRLYAEGVVGSSRRRLLLLLQGMDTSGKDGATKHVDAMMNPQGLRITSFKAPTPTERRHDFLWRIGRAVPGPGYVGIFNRSQYEDVLIVRVHSLVPESEWSTRYDRINSFERGLQDDGVHLVKVFLHISKKEQQARLLARLDDPTKHWKYNRADVDERAFWDQYMAAYTDVLDRCSPEAVPWYLVPADRKWYRNWAVGRLVLEALQDMAPQYPPADFDVSAERRRVLDAG
jgi:PPK2 family polyphosphate:nucleotide phosphotransferase